MNMLLQMIEYALREQGSTMGVYDFVANVNVFN